jgi:hypothetical protein
MFSEESSVIHNFSSSSYFYLFIQADLIRFDGVSGYFGCVD